MNRDPKCPCCYVLLLSSGRCARCGMEEALRPEPIEGFRVRREWPCGHWETYTVSNLRAHRPEGAPTGSHYTIEPPTSEE